MVTQSPSGDGDSTGLPHPRCAAPGEKHVYVFVPQPEITADEMAASSELLMYGIAVAIKAAPRQACDILYAGMDAAVRRHWQVQDMSQIAAAQKSKALYVPPGSR